MRLGPWGQTLVGAAAGIAVVTVASRLVGFARTAVLARTVGPTDVGDTYTAVNALPNVLFEVAAGGALAAVVVPLVAGALVTGDRAQVDRTVSALLSWAVVVLLPLALLVALTAPLLVRLVLGDGTGEGATEVGTRMLRVFAPQVLLYGLVVVLTGVLHAHRRFLAPALAPLLSSLVVITAYLVYDATGAVSEPAALTLTQELVLSVGTTLGAVALAVGVLVPLRRTGVRVRPTLSFPPGVATRARALAGSGLIGLLAQQVSLLVALRLAAGGEQGEVVVYTIAVTAFLVPWAVLAVPFATSAFPRLSEASAQDDTQAFRSVLLRSTGYVAAAAVVGAVALVLVAGPLAAVLLPGGAAPGAADTLQRTLVALAPGLLGHSLSALFSRALLARGRARASALGTAAGWAVVAVASLVLARGDDRAPSLGLAGSVGMTAGAVVLGLLLVRRPGVSARG